MRREDLYVRSSLEYDGFDDFLSDRGLNPKSLMRQFGLDSSPSESKIHYISWAKYASYFELAAQKAEDPYLGLKWAFAMPKDYRSSGPTLFLTSTASNLRHFLDMAIEYQKIHTNGVAYSYVEDGVAREIVGFIDIHPLSPSCRQYCEHIVAGVVIMANRYVSNFKLKRASFQYSAPEDLTWYEKAFECPIEFDAPRNTIVVDSSLFKLEKAQLTTKLIKPFAKAYLGWQLDRNPQSKASITGTVIQTLPTILGLRSSDINTVAEVLDLHPKKLQRLLSDEGTTYSNVLNDVRKSLAERLLAESNISVERMAKLLDYASDRPFTAAMRRWHDMTPTQYRKLAKQKARHP